MKKVLITLAIAAVALVAISSPAMAQGNRFKIYAAVAYVSPLDSSDITIESVEESVEAASEVGYDFGFEFRFGKWLGVELDYLNATHDIESDGTKFAEADLKPLTLGLNFHVIHTKVIDFYVAPNVSFVEWGDLKFTDGDSESLDSETVFGVTVGVDVSLVKSVALVGSLRYLDLSANASDSDESLAVNPLITRIGIAFRW